MVETDETKMKLTVMGSHQCRRQVLYSPLLTALIVLLASVDLSQAATRQERNSEATMPRIAITRVPPKGAGLEVMENIAGRANGVDTKQVRVVLFAHTNTWYVQPYAASPYTAIAESGNWETKSHLGDEYAALLVEASYRPPATTDTLPEVAGPVLAIARVAARATGGGSVSVPSKLPSTNETRVRTIQFSGYAWKVKSSRGRVGPGPNYFSDSRSNIDVDSRGRLHLRISRRDGRWYCAEVISERSFGYGTYKFYLETRVDAIDARVVLGMFTWSDDPAYSHREIDIEISRWGDVDNKNAQFVVQPYTRPMNIVRFQIPPELGRTTHSFSWQSGSVFCRSWKGFVSAPIEIIQQHTFTHDIPQAGGENARVNLWLMTGEPPADGKEMEIIVNKFEFLASK